MIGVVVVCKMSAFNMDTFITVPTLHYSFLGEPACDDQNWSKACYITVVLAGIHSIRRSGLGHLVHLPDVTVRCVQGVSPSLRFGISNLLLVAIPTLPHCRRLLSQDFVQPRQSLNHGPFGRFIFRNASWQP